MSVSRKFTESSLRWVLTALFLMAALPVSRVFGVSANSGFSQSAQMVDAYDLVEIILNITSPDAKNPFIDVTVEGQFSKAGGNKRHLWTASATHRMAVCTASVSCRSSPKHTVDTALRIKRF
jgi:hypothetical protein